MALTPESTAGSVGADETVEVLLNAANEAPGFGLNGRALILQAAQRAGKKRKASHLAPKDADSAKLHAAEQRDSNSTAPLEQHSPQLAVPAGIDTSARAFQQDTKARADSQGVQPREQKQPTLQSAPRRSEALSTAATDALIDGLDPHDQPLVAYINRSSVPRILRQGVAKRLAGQQLARLLQDAGMAVIPATARSTEAAALRKHAAQAALAQEMSIYRKGIGKQVYMNNAARQQACLSYLPAEARPPQQQGAAEDGAGLSRPYRTSSDQAPQHSSAAASAQPAVNVSEIHQSQISNSLSCAVAPQQSPTEQKDAGRPISKDAEAPSISGGDEGAAKGVQLEEAEIDWSAGDTSLQQREQADGHGSPKAEGDQRSWSNVDSEEYDPEGALLDIDSHVLSPRPRSSENRQHGSAHSDRGAHSAAEPDREKSGEDAASKPSPYNAAPAVQKATLRFVKAILNPLYAAQVISRAVYKFVLLKVTTKVMQGHGADADATFLVAESGHIQRLVQDYIKHCQLHGIGT